MRKIIASDIHGSAYWAARLMEQIDIYQPDELILLGDILYHGPRNDLPRDYNPREVIAMLNPLSDSITCCRGNCEAEVDQMVLDFDVMADYNLVLDDPWELFCTHGHLYDPKDADRLNLSEGAYFLYGHTHKKVSYTTLGGIHVFNPGSVSIPKDGSNSIGLFEDGVLTHIILISS